MREYSFKYSSIFVVISAMFLSFAFADASSTPSCSLLDIKAVFKIGSRSDTVFVIQKVLNSDPDTTIATSGPGSLGFETNKFGLKTKEAVLRFQEKYKEDVLIKAKLKRGTGQVGGFTRIKMKEVCERGLESFSNTDSSSSTEDVVKDVVSTSSVPATNALLGMTLGKSASSLDVADALTSLLERAKADDARKLALDQQKARLEMLAAASSTATSSAPLSTGVTSTSTDDSPLKIPVEQISPLAPRIFSPFSTAIYKSNANVPLLYVVPVAVKKARVYIDDGFVTTFNAASALQRVFLYGVDVSLLGDGDHTIRVALEFGSGKIATSSPTHFSVLKSLVGGGTALGSQPVNGVCGQTHQRTLVATSSKTLLCEVGTPSFISGDGPWTWVCVGENGGKSASCSASVPK